MAERVYRRTSRRRYSRPFIGHAVLAKRMAVMASVSASFVRLHGNMVAKCVVS